MGSFLGHLLCSSVRREVCLGGRLHVVFFHLCRGLVWFEPHRWWPNIFSPLARWWLQLFFLEEVQFVLWCLIDQFWLLRFRCWDFQALFTSLRCHIRFYEFAWRDYSLSSRLWYANFSDQWVFRTFFCFCMELHYICLNEIHCI